MGFFRTKGDLVRHVVGVSFRECVSVGRRISDPKSKV